MGGFYDRGSEHGENEVAFKDIEFIELSSYLFGNVKEKDSKMTATYMDWPQNDCCCHPPLHQSRYHQFCFLVMITATAY